MITSNFSGMSAQSKLIVVASGVLFVVVAAVIGRTSQKLPSSLQIDATDTVRRGNAFKKHKTSAISCPKVSIEEFREKELLKSQSREDERLLSFFNGLCGGTYIEMGGLDGVLFSNSYAFNKGVLKWKGLMVEADVGSHTHLVVNRPDELVTPVNAAACDRKQQLHYMPIGDAQVHGIWEFADEEFRETWWPNATKEDGEPVQCKPLNQLLRENVPSTTYFDFFSLDVEGAEFSILETFDFSKVGFGIIFLELSSFPRKYWALRSILEANGYRYMYDEDRSSWFINEDFHNIYRGLYTEYEES